MDQIIIYGRNRPSPEIARTKPNLGNNNRAYNSIWRTRDRTPSSTLARANIVPLKTRMECRRIRLIWRLWNRNLWCLCIWQRAALCRCGSGRPASHHRKYKQHSKTRRVVHGSLRTCCFILISPIAGLDHATKPAGGAAGPLRPLNAHMQAPPWRTSSPITGKITPAAGNRPN